MSNPKKGEQWESLDPRCGVCRVMSEPIENYVMARYKRALPFVVHVSCWHILFKRIDKNEEVSE